MKNDEDNPVLRGFDDFVVTLGDELRGERATRGKSLLDVQRDLRIKASYIAAIENCDVSVFPNQGFVAGYVRSYARYLGIDPDQMYVRFCHESGFSGVNASLSAGRTTAQKPTHQVLKGGEAAPKFSGRVTPVSASVLETVSPSGIASVVVLLALIMGLGYGGWTLLQDIQRVEFAPVDQPPGLNAAVDTIAPPASEPGIGDLANLTTDGDEAGPSALDRLYRPQELAVPRLEPRDGPIAAIDPNEVGVLRPAPLPETSIDTLVAEALQSTEEFQGPVVTVEAGPPPVELLATRAAWVRVYEADGTVLFEKILEKGERYTVPVEAEAPLLRAGNSGSVYVLVDDQAYGPVGPGTSVAKQVSLAAVDVTDGFELASDLEIPDDPSVSTAATQ